MDLGNMLNQESPTFRYILFWFLLKYFANIFHAVVSSYLSGLGQFSLIQECLQIHPKCALCIFQSFVDMHTRTCLSIFTKHLMYVVFSNTYSSVSHSV